MYLTFLGYIYSYNWLNILLCDNLVKNKPWKHEKHNFIIIIIICIYYLLIVLFQLKFCILL